MNDKNDSMEIPQRIHILQIDYSLKFREAPEKPVALLSGYGSDGDIPSIKQCDLWIFVHVFKLKSGQYIRQETGQYSELCPQFFEIIYTMRNTTHNISDVIIEISLPLTNPLNPVYEIMHVSIKWRAICNAKTTTKQGTLTMIDLDIMLK